MGYKLWLESDQSFFIGEFEEKRDAVEKITSCIKENFPGSHYLCSWPKGGNPNVLIYDYDSHTNFFRLEKVK